MKITFELDLKDANYILALLAKQPYEQVHQLIAELVNQAKRAPQEGTNAPA